MFAFLLYVLTAIVTALPLVATWGVGGLAFPSLMGFALAAVISLFRAREAAWVALISAVGCWIFYGPTVVKATRATLTDQRLQVIFVKHQPGPEPLSVEEEPAGVVLRHQKLAAWELTQLRATGLTGRLTVGSSGGYGNRGKEARVVIVMQRQLDSPVDLYQPDGTNVIYLQEGTRWRMIPPDAPTLRGTIHLEVYTYDPRDTVYDVELSTGSRQGSTAFIWPATVRKRSDD